MKTGISTRRLRALSLALAAAFPMHSMAQDATLKEVVVTASRFEQAITDAVADVTLIDRQEIERRGAQNFTELLQSIGGVFVSANKVYVRGAESRMTALMIDGVRVDSQDGLSLGGGAPWDLIPISQIDRIEVLQGPASALYGADAMGGVIQVITRRGESGVRPSVQLGFGSNNETRVGASIAATSGPLDYAMGVNSIRSDGINTRPDLDHTPKTEGFGKIAASAQIGAQFNQANRLSLQLTSQRNEAKSVGWAGGTDTNEKGSLDVGSLALVSKWSPSFESTLRLGKSVSAKSDDADLNDYKTTLNTFSAQGRLINVLGEFTGHIEQRMGEFTAKPTIYDLLVSGKRTQNALGLGYGLYWDNHVFQLKARADDDSVFGTKTTGLFAYSYSFTKALKASAYYGTGFRAPTLEQTYGPYGSIALVPETNTNTDIGLNYQDNSSILKIVVYKNQFANLLSSSQTLNTCSAGFFCYYNVGKASVEGIALNGSQQLGALTFAFGSNWMNARNDETGKRLSLRPNQSHSISMGYGFENWNFGVEVRDVGDRFDNASNTITLAPYTLLNVWASRLVNKEWTMRLRVNNVTDKKYFETDKVATPGLNVLAMLQWAPK